MKKRKKTAKGEPRQEGKFLEFLKLRETKRDLLILALVNLVIYILFVNLYPYMDTTTDTDTYLLSAKDHTISGYRPYGYSWFVAVMHSISPTFRFLFIAQFILIFISEVFLLLSVKYLFKLKRQTFYVLSALVVLSPSIIYCINYIMSESLFTALTFIFMASCLWLLTKPNFWILAAHLLVMAFAIYVRYTALFYPLFSAVVLWYHYRGRGLYKAIALVPLLVMFIVYNNIKKEYTEEVGIETFSGFSGWALANNAVSVLPYIDLDKEDIKDKELQFIHEICTYYPDSVYSHEMINSTAFMWDNKLAGKQYFINVMENRDMVYVPAWAYSSLRLKEYAIMLIKKYPGLFFKHFLWPNFLQTFQYYPLPEPTDFKPIEGVKTYYGVAVEEYHFKNNVFGGINRIRKITDPLLWILFLGSVTLYFIKRKKLHITVHEQQLIHVMLLFSLMFIMFCVVSHPINNFRYLIPVYFIKVFLPVLVISKIGGGRKREALK